MEWLWEEECLMRWNGYRPINARQERVATDRGMPKPKSQVKDEMKWLKAQ